MTYIKENIIKLFQVDTLICSTQGNLRNYMKTKHSWSGKEYLEYYNIYLNDNKFLHMWVLIAGKLTNIVEDFEFGGFNIITAKLTNSPVETPIYTLTHVKGEEETRFIFTSGQFTLFDKSFISKGEAINWAMNNNYSIFIDGQILYS